MKNRFFYAALLIAMFAIATTGCGFSQHWDPTFRMQSGADARADSK